ncbi:MULTISPECIES: hypothetical protein [unclassified Leisingera]|uniref:hypothetical protein n=1 Tax=unclassified Leisingera TaxID=2614906 RepID=UPI0005807792|nr:MULTISPECIES: hypothetical protein [unclassified Leisingera]KIC16110.1 hypothetical protein RA21_13755 [Leisingera sp. ANG-DT]KIC30301.1 hypothetical protein RA24_03035 [Leisingera sp. ANG-M6]KIC33200.1 hypothetical protein RA25_07980 [Leisingera sp. ANG-S5]
MFDVILAIIAASARPGVDSGAPAAAAAAPAAEAVQTALTAEPQEATGSFTTALEVKPILAATQANWIHVREFDGQDLLYVTHLWSWRCGLAQIKLGVNGQAPEIWPLPDCHLDEGFPNMIKEEDGLPYRSYPLGSIQQIAVEVTYDDLTSESLTFGRNGQPVQ